MTQETPGDKFIEIARGMVWSYDHYCPHAARRFIEKYGPFSGMTPEESVGYHTEQLRRGVVTGEGIDPHKAIADLRAALKDAGYDPAPWPDMIDFYQKEGLLPLAKEQQ